MPGQNSNCSENSVSLVRLKRWAMGTHWEVVVPFGFSGPLEWADRAFEVLSVEESRLSIFRSNSEVSRLNRLPAGQEIQVSKSLFDLLVRCRKWWEDSDGCLDIACGGMIDGWGFARGPVRLPKEEDVAVWVHVGGMCRLAVNPVGRRVSWWPESGGLNFGAVGKGFALDQMGNDLRRSGWPCAMIHGGRSSVLAWGTPPGEPRGWRVALHHPWKDAIMAEVEIFDGAMGTSAATYKFVEVNRRRLGHVLDPRTGRPVENCGIVSVLAPDGAEADALSTAIYVGGVEIAKKLAAGRDDLGILFLSANGNICLLGALANRFNLGFSRG